MGDTIIKPIAMKTQTALDIIAAFKGTDLKHKLKEISDSAIGKHKGDLPNLSDAYIAALEIKKVSSQIDEIVHATGIIQCLPYVMGKDEVIVSLSLAAGAAGDGIDLVTNNRIAEFKFARWQDDAANGMRKRQVFSDVVSLFLNPAKKQKEMYVVHSTKVLAYLTSKKSQWRNALSKHPARLAELEKHLLKYKITANTVGEIYQMSGVKVWDVEEILKHKK
jgi:hypothetical protein